MVNTEISQLGKIYRLYTIDSPWIYYGSTTQKNLSSRLRQHKERAILCPDNEMYTVLNEIGWDKVKIELVKEIPFKNRFELNDAENEYILNNIDNPYTLNKQHSSLQLSNLKLENKYQNMKKNKISNQTKTLYLQKQQEYRNRTKNHKKLYDIEYHKRNADYIKERSKIKIQCSCGAIVTKSHLKRHENSIQHQTHLNNANTSGFVLSENNKE